MCFVTLPGCLSGRWGADCRHQCGQCESKRCNNHTGDCEPPGCQPGWDGSRCDTECAPGSYGSNCSQKCGHCHGACSPLDGQCPAHCRPGWLGPMCLDKCSNHTYGQDCALVCGHCSDGEECDHVTGHCPGSCITGFDTPLCHIRTKGFSLSRPNLVAMLIGCMVIFSTTIVTVFICLLVRWRRDNQHGVVDKHPQPYKQTVV
ncbi:multiple epidermal growth factor-like domains 10 [Elysia marginata]|uniref:Multiple epidermal growth factor-like domains 10 n=1 Tax=Elysia marginata TaxID=1093978 RepID=A0AAV4EM70_9GAST|nr:multiple epidermal growth factor-like domains 10 [Elysia marginata]